MALVKFEVLVTRNEGTAQQENDIYVAYFEMAFLPRKDENINVGDTINFKIDSVEHAIDPDGEAEVILQSHMPEKDLHGRDGQLMQIYGFVKQ